MKSQPEIVEKTRHILRFNLLVEYELNGVILATFEYPKELADKGRRAVNQFVLDEINKPGFTDKEAAKILSGYIFMESMA